jgi:hypothetical protein
MIYDLLDIRKADQMGSKGRISTGTGLLEKMVYEELHRPVPLKLVVNGYDIMAACSLPTGDEVGRILAHLKEQVIDDPSLNERSTLIKLARSFNGGE